MVFDRFWIVVLLKVKPEIINKFGFNNSTSSTGLTRFKSLTNRGTDTPLTARSQVTTAEKPQKRIENFFFILLIH